MSELETIKTLDPQPFKNLVATVGNLPTSFVDSMSYYEMLAWLCNYIETQIIPTVNSYAGAIEEVQRLYLELKEYVDNYFDNLDVQEEINNKLDDMAESGQLAEIITIYLQMNAILAYNTVADLSESETVVDGSFARTYGKEEYNDGKGAFYKIREKTNADVIDGENIVGLTDDELVAEKMPDYNIELLDEKIDKVKNSIKSVKDYGAVGDGSTDDTIAIVTALNALENGDKLYFPAGDYIVYSDYAENTTNPSYPINKILKLVEKKNISIFGDGVNSRIRPPYQGVSQDKLYFPCTLTIDKCEDIEIYGLTIESKGESYGDADAGASVSQAQRQEFVMANGGSAILISGSKRVNLHDCEFRFCGSCGVVYHSDVTDCIVRNCFSNSASYGYAGFALDTFCYNSGNYNHTVWYDGCVIKPETRKRPEDNSTVIGSTTCSGKCGICTEGTASILCNVKISNCELSGARSNSSNNYREGEALILQMTTADVIGNKFYNNEGGICVGDMLAQNNASKINVIDNDIESKWFAFWINEMGATTENKLNFIGNIVKVNSETVPESATATVKANPAIAISSYSNAEVNVKSNIITGCKFLINADSHVGTFEISDNTITSNKFIYAYGGGDFTIKENNVKLTNTTSTDTGSIYNLSTVAGDNTTVGYLLFTSKNNLFDISFYKNHLVVNSNRLDLVTKFDVENEKISNGFLANQSVLKDFKGMIAVECDYKDTPTADYSRIRFKFNGGIMPFGLPLIQDIDGAFHKSENYISFDESAGTATYYIHDASANDGFTVDESYMMIFHRNA